jgi:zinc protease
MRNAAIARDDHPRDDVPFVREVGGIEEYRLAANGLRVLYMPIAAMPVALTMLTYAVGSRHEPPGLKGASHMIEHMMFKGTDRYRRALGTSIHDLLHPFGAQVNATTWMDRTHYFNLVPVEQLDLSLEIEADRMRGLRMEADDLEAERAVVLNEHDLYAGDPLERLHQALWSAAFPAHPYGHPVLGTREDILGLQRDALFDFYHRHYRPDNATLTVIGDVARERVLDLARRHFGDIAVSDAHVDADTAPEPAQRGERRITLAQATPPDWVMLGYRTPDGRSADLDALELLGLILVGGKLSRLYRPLLASGLATHAWSSVARLHDPGLFQVQAQPALAQDHARVERMIRDAIDAIRRDGVTDAEVARAQGFLRGQLATGRDGPMAMAMQLNEAIAAGDWTRYATVLDRIAAVTPADVQRVANAHLVDTQLTVGHLAHDPGHAEADA